jgi:TonB family protein
MRILLWAAFILAFGVSNGNGQKRPEYVSPTAPNAPPGTERVYFSAPGLTQPELIPPQTATFSTAKCRYKLSGTVRLSLVVDAEGHARDVYFDHPLGNGLDLVAPSIAEADQFKPGTLLTQPVAVGQLVDIRMDACIDETKDASGKKVATVRLRSMPEQKFFDAPEPEEALFLQQARPADTLQSIGHGVAAPKQLVFREAEFSDYARRNKINGAVVLSLVVDAHGLPQKVHVVRSLEASLDEKALDAVYGYRFKPAIKEGHPVPVPVNIEVMFRLY